jgi:hypothetical protein
MVRDEKRDRPEYADKRILAVKRRWPGGFTRVETVARVMCGTLMCLRVTLTAPSPNRGDARTPKFEATWSCKEADIELTRDRKAKIFRDPILYIFYPISVRLLQCDVYVNLVGLTHTVTRRVLCLRFFPNRRHCKFHLFRQYHAIYKRHGHSSAQTFLESCMSGFRRLHYAILIDTCTSFLSMTSRIALIASDAITCLDPKTVSFSIAASVDSLHQTNFTINKYMNFGPMIVFQLF